MTGYPAHSVGLPMWACMGHDEHRWCVRAALPEVGDVGRTYCSRCGVVIGDAAGRPLPFRPRPLKKRDTRRPTGKVKIKLILWLMDRDGDVCTYCGCTLTNHFNPDRVRTIDHRVPLATGGTSDPANLVLACGPCNHHKADRDEDYLRSTQWFQERKRHVDRLARCRDQTATDA